MRKVGAGKAIDGIGFAAEQVIEYNRRLVKLYVGVRRIL